MSFSTMDPISWKFTGQPYDLNSVLTPDQVWAKLDVPAEEVRQSLISLINALNAQSASSNVGFTPNVSLGNANTVQTAFDSLVSLLHGTGGAEWLKSVGVTGLTGDNVQTLLESLKAYIDRLDEENDQALTTHKLPTTNDHDGRYYTENEVDGFTVKKTGDQTITGVKTFSSSPIVPTPTTDMQASTKKYVDDNFTTKNDITTNRKLSATGDFRGTLNGAPITATDPGLSSTVDALKGSGAAEEKANLSFVTAHLAENAQYKTTNDANILALQTDKADKTEVNSLATAKADISYVDTKTQGVSLAYKESYATLAALQTAYPTGDTYNHAVLADGYIYTWVNSAWTSTQIQANGTGIANNSVEKRTISEDIFEIDHLTLNGISFPASNNNAAYVLVIPLSSATVNIDISGVLKQIIGTNRCASFGYSFYKSNTTTLMTSDSTNATTGGSISCATDETPISISKSAIDFTGYTYLKLYLQFAFSNTTSTPSDLSVDDFKVLVNGAIASVVNKGQWANGTNLATGTYDLVLTGKKRALSEDDLANLVTPDQLNNYATLNDIVVHNIVTVGVGKYFANPVLATKSIATTEANNKANVHNVYDIFIDAGTYDIASQLNLADIVDQTLYKRGWEIPDYVNLYGIGNVILTCDLGSGASAANVQAISTLNTYGENHFENLTIKAKNCRYAVHDDDGGAYKNRTISFKNCNLIHEGNVAGAWTAQEAYGAGYTGGRKGVFENCIFNSATSLPFFVHNSTAYWATDIFEVLLDSCAFVTPAYEASASFNGAYSTGLKNIVTVKNCKLDKALRFNGDYNEFIAFGGGNNDFNIINTSGITSYLTGNHAAV